MCRVLAAPAAVPLMQDTYPIQAKNRATAERSRTTREMRELEKRQGGPDTPKVKVCMCICITAFHFIHPNIQHPTSNRTIKQHQELREAFGLGGYKRINKTWARDLLRLTVNDLKGVPFKEEDNPLSSPDDRYYRCV